MVYNWESHHKSALLLWAGERTQTPIQSKCWPLLLQILCRERLFTLKEGETEDDWHEAGLKQLKPFADLQSI